MLSQFWSHSIISYTGILRWTLSTYTSEAHDIVFMMWFFGWCLSFDCFEIFLPWNCQFILDLSWISILSFLLLLLKWLKSMLITINRTIAKNHLFFNRHCKFYDNGQHGRHWYPFNIANPYMYCTFISDIEIKAICISLELYCYMCQNIVMSKILNE